MKNPTDSLSDRELILKLLQDEKLLREEVERMNTRLLSGKTAGQDFGLVTFHEMTKLLQVSARTLDTYIEYQLVPCVPLRGSRFFILEDVKKYWRLRFYNKDIREVLQIV